MPGRRVAAVRRGTRRERSVPGAWALATVSAWRTTVASGRWARVVAPQEQSVVRACAAAFALALRSESKGGVDTGLPGGRYGVSREGTARGAVRNRGPRSGA